MVQFYCLDFGGGALASLRDWPHVGSVAGRADPERVRRTLARLAAVIRSRETLFQEHGIESIEHYRQLRTKRDPLCDRFGDIFLIIDGWLGLQRELDTAEASVTALAAEGLSYGVHVAVSASRWAEVRPALRDQIGTRIELRLGDPADSELNRGRAQQVPEGEPGRGLTHEGLHMVVALPRLDGHDSNAGLADAGSQVGEMLRWRHGRWTAPPIALLPRQIEYDRVIEQVDAIETGVIIGIEESELEPLAIDFTHQLHLLVLGESECGKTATLRVLCRELLRTTTAVQLFIVDPRRSLLGIVEPETGQLGGYAASGNAVGELVSRLAEMLCLRMPPPNATSIQMRRRSWWSGPEIYVVVDDYDLLAATGGNPLAPLLDVASVQPRSRIASCGCAQHQRCRPSHVRATARRPARCRLHDVADEREPRGGIHIGTVRPSQLPPGRGVLITRRGDPEADPGRLDTGTVRSHVIEVGPNAVRRLCCGGATAADAEVERTAFESIDDRVALVDLQPVAVAALWEDVLGSIDCGTSERVTVVHPSWWSPARVGVVSAAARTLVGAGEIRPRSWLLAQASPSKSERDTLVVEIADRFVVLTGAAMAAEARRRDQIEVAGAVARSVLTMASETTETVVIDAPATVHGAGTLAASIAERLRGSCGMNVMLVDDIRMRRLAGELKSTDQRRLDTDPQASTGGDRPSTGADNAGACHRRHRQCCCLATS